MVWKYRWKYDYFRWVVAIEFGSKVLRRIRFLKETVSHWCKSEKLLQGWLGFFQNYTKVYVGYASKMFWSLLLNLWTERNGSLWIPRSNKKQVNSKIRKIFEKNQPDMYMWTGIERFDANRFVINGQPTYAPEFFNHTDKVWMYFLQFES